MIEQHLTAELLQIVAKEFDTSVPRNLSGMRTPTADIASSARRTHTVRNGFLRARRSRTFTDYPALRAALGALLVNRLPGVDLLTCGRGVPMLMASYASERGRTVTACVADFIPFPVDAVERRDAFLVTEADAAVIVGGSRPEREARAGARGAEEVPVATWGKETRSSSAVGHGWSDCSPPTGG